MRKDALGLFWRDEPVIRIKKEKPKVVAPDPIWLRDDYLPGLQEAEEMRGIQLLSDSELIALARGPKQELAFDIEVYRNYYLAGFRHRGSDKVVYIESTEDGHIDIDKLKWILDNFTIVGFNSAGYDVPVTSMALAGLSLRDMKEASDRIIHRQEPWRDVLRSYKVKPIEIDHIDLIEVAPLRASLKIYGGRMHTRQMQDLPFHPDKSLLAPQKVITRYYCLAKDLPSVLLLRETLDEQLALRVEMGRQYKMDLRSRSDAQIAEHVISHEVQNLNGKRVSRPNIPPGTVYRYKVPAYLQYKSPLLQWALEVVRNAKFIVADHGSIDMPPEIGDLKLEINGSVYTMGIGGLHSTEKRVAHVQDDQYEIYDFDVTSYYPKIILNQGLYPYHLGPNFLRVYNKIVQARVAAKQKGDKVTANSLKIVVNGSYGKLGSKYSNLYSPDLLIQVTLTGQLSLLLLIERLELAGIHVISANTDGIVVKPRRTQVEQMKAIVKQWERDTNFEMEESRYLALYSRDVNNYIAIKKKFDKQNNVWLDIPDGTKTKGAYANPWSSNDDKSFWLHKNPTNTICVEAVEALLTKGVPLATTIRSCRDIRKFVSVRTVKGGAYKDGVYLGKSIRWYYATGVKGPIVYALKGSKVPRSDGAKPLMDLPDEFPDDVDFAWYEAEAEKILKEIGYL